MSLHVHREISCDDGGKSTFLCGGTYDGAPWHTTANEVRRAAAEERGWTRRNGLDLCARHSSPAVASSPESTQPGGAA